MGPFAVTVTGPGPMVNVGKYTSSIDPMGISLHSVSSNRKIDQIIFGRGPLDKKGDFLGNVCRNFI